MSQVGLQYERGEELAKIPLRAARVAAGFTQAGLAEKIGVSRESIVNWETGKTKIRPVNLYAICNATGFTEDDILLPETTT